jgi:hypothetical protein
MLRGVEGEFDDRTRAAESQNVDVRAVHRVYEDRYSPLCQFRQHRLEGRMAEVTPKHVRGQRHSVEPQFVQGVRELRQRLVGTVRGQRGEGSEPLGVHRDQVGVPSLIIRDRRIPNSGSSSDPANVIGMETSWAAISCRSI